MTGKLGIAGRLIDKLVFGAALLLALQIPQLADHYQQFLSGLYESTKWQVEGYQATADQYEYLSVNAMIEHHLQNNVASVREDARQKLVTLNLYKELKTGMSIFENGNLLSKTVYIFNPARYNYLEKTLQHFKPGMPLTLNGLVFGVIVGWIINLVLTLPFILWSRRKMPNKQGA